MRKAVFMFSIKEEVMGLMSSLRSWSVSVLLLVVAPLCSGAAPWGTIVVEPQSEAERLATSDLQRYLAQVTGRTPQVIELAKWKAAPVPAVLLARPAEMKDETPDLGDQGYVLANAKSQGADIVVAAGATGQGTVNAVYGLLRELGYGFYLGSEAIPEALPERLPSERPIVRKPVFTMRGVLPWYNFLNSPTTWDPVDHRAFVDQLIRGGANFVGFHTYHDEPFAAYEKDGKMVGGKRLLNTASSVWYTHPMACRDFAWGIDKLYAGEYFGAATTLGIKDENEAIRQEQRILRDALAYAKMRGLHTCVGFEISGDPTDPGHIQEYIRKLKRLVDAYPGVDYVWIWESEGTAQRGMGEEWLLNWSPNTLLQHYAVARSDAFRRIIEGPAVNPGRLKMDAVSKADRAREGARLEQFAHLARRVLGQCTGAPKLIVSGWGGDGHLMCQEFFEGLDQLLPKDVAFSALDQINAVPHVDRAYGLLSKDRQRWPIVWLEYDGDQWHAQANVRVFEGAVRDAYQKGCQGLLGIHWRTRDVEENFAYLMDFAWQPGLTADEFFMQFARRRYIPAIAEQMARIHVDLDNLGYRWLKGNSHEGQAECGRFTFNPARVENVQKLQEVRDRVAGVLPKAGKSADLLKRLLAQIDWSLVYWKVESAAAKADTLLQQNQPAQAMAELDKTEPDFAWALRTYATRLTTRGEYGVLATINTKAVWQWRDLRDKAAKALGKNSVGAASVPDWKPEPQVLVPRLVTSAVQRQPLEWETLSLGGRPVWMHYRLIGQRAWKSQSLREVAGWVNRGVIPAEDIASPAIEVAFSFSDSAEGPMAWGPQAVTVMPDLPPSPPQTKDSNIAPVKNLNLRCDHSVKFPFELRWENLADAEYFNVYRDGVLVGSTCVPYLSDVPGKPALQHEYKVEAVAEGKVIAQQSLVAKSPDISLAADAFAPQVVWKKGGLGFTWPPAKDLNVACIRIRRAEANKPGQWELVAEIPATLLGMNRFATPLSAGRQTWRLVPVNQANVEQKPVEYSFDWPSKDLADVAMRGGISTAKAAGPVKVQGEEATFVATPQSCLSLPHQDCMSLAGGGMVSFEFKSDRIKERAVIVSHREPSTVNGWEIVVEGRNLVLIACAKKILISAIEPGQWHAFRWDYDGLKATFSLDGKTVRTDVPLMIGPAASNLTIALPSDRNGWGQFVGGIRNFKLSGVLAQ